jgi:hypothetical protein
MERGKILVRNDALWDHQEQGEKYPETQQI